VPGFALYDELDDLVEAGLSPAEALAAATVNGALATRREGEFGELVLGARADLVMFPFNPNLQVPDPGDVRGVMIRGRWLDAAALEDLRARFAAVCADAPPADAWRDAAWRARLAADAESLAARGYRFPPEQLAALAAALAAAGDAAAGAAVAALSPPAE
jgi:adenine deaminase